MLFPSVCYKLHIGLKCQETAPAHVAIPMLFVVSIRLKIFCTVSIKGTSATLEMESCKSNAVILTYNGTLNATTSSTPANMPRDGSSTESRDGSIQSYIQGVQATSEELGHSDCVSVEVTAESLSNQEDVNQEMEVLPKAIRSLTLTSLLENTHAPISASTGSGERTVDVVNPYTQTIIPENEGELGEDGVDGQDLTAANMDCDQALLELHEHVRAGFRARGPYLNINLHKYKASNSTCLESKEECCICLDEYCDGEEIAKLDCGHLFHVGCIRKWNKLEKTCPICKRRVLTVGYATLRIRAFLVHLAAAKQLSFGPVV